MQKIAWHRHEHQHNIEFVFTDVQIYFHSACISITYQRPSKFLASLILCVSVAIFAQASVSWLRHSQQLQTLVASAKTDAAGERE